MFSPTQKNGTSVLEIQNKLAKNRVKPREKQSQPPSRFFVDRPKWFLRLRKNVGLWAEKIDLKNGPQKSGW